MSDHPNQGGKSSTAIILAVGCGIAFAASIPCLLTFAAISIPNFISMQYRAKRSEIPVNLKGIKTAQIQYEANFSEFVPCSRYPYSPSKASQEWDITSSGGFERIGWAPDQGVRGVYQVEVINGGRNFRATGISDIDGDGVYATYVATKSENPTSPITGPDVY